MIQLTNMKETTKKLPIDFDKDFNTFLMKEVLKKKRISNSDYNTHY